MGYVAIKGGEDAINNALKLVEYYRLQSGTEPLTLDQIRTQFRFAIDKVMGEGSLYGEEHAALALKQVEGDLFEASFMLRAFRATLDRNYYSETLDVRDMEIEKRVSGAFRDIPGGQLLGATRQYEHKFLKPQLLEESLENVPETVERLKEALKRETWNGERRLPKIVDILAKEGVLRGVDPEPAKLVDITLEAIKYPAPRSATLQMLARGEMGGMTSLAYSTMRGFGDIEPTLGELRVGRVSVRIKDRRGRVRSIGRIRVTEAEVLSRRKDKVKDPVPYLTMGYGLVFGQNESKAIAMGMLDRSVRTSDGAPASSQEFVLYHTEGIEAYGFTNHLKLPHYVTFQSGLNNVRQAMKRKQKQRQQWTVGTSYAGREGEGT